MTVSNRLRQGAPFQPNQLGGLAAWYKADAITGLSDGNAVATWADISGNARHATQATAGLRPLYKTGILNSGPVVRFDGSNDYLATAVFGVALAQPTAYLAVVKLAVTGANYVVFDGTSGNRNFLGPYDTGVWTLFGGSAEIQGGTPTTSWHVLEAYFAGASSTLRVDGTQVLTGNPGSNALGGLVLGVNGADLASGALNGDMAEVCVYNPPASLAGLRAVARGLGAKYGLTVA